MWWNSMTVFQQAMFIIACAASLFLIIQIILMLASGASDSDISGGGVTDADASDIGGGGIKSLERLTQIGFHCREYLLSVHAIVPFLYAIV